ncbi:MAG: 4Fe-4S binding protein [Acetivibrionales bacterium]
MANKKKAALLTDECVACGCCVKSCPMGAISIYKGLHAIWNPGRI